MFWVGTHVGTGNGTSDLPGVPPRPPIHHRQTHTLVSHMGHTPYPTPRAP